MDIFTIKLTPIKCIIFFLTILLTSCAASKNPVNKEDPLEPLNRKLYIIHKTADALYINPMVQVYSKVIPTPLRKIFGNFFNNISELPVIVNSLLQGKIQQARDSTARLTLNSTLGIFGLFDVASHANLKFKKTDLGETFYQYGYKSSSYLFVPILGPTTVRDGLVFIGNIFISIPYHFFKPKWRNRYNLTYLLHRKSELKEFESLIDIAGVDEYAFMKNSYLQNRSYVLGDPSYNQ